MNTPIKYIVGQKIGGFGLRFLSDSPKYNKHRSAKFECICGTIFKTYIKHVKNGHTKSCGCLAIVLAIAKTTKHGDSNSHYLYSTWAHMKQRCNNKNKNSYHRYGGRGITYHVDWEKYIPFKKWVLDNLGERPLSYTLDRIDNDGHYEHGNIRFVTAKVNANNRRKR